MPSGYTADIYDGKDVTAEDFILRCARAFGGLIHMREDSSSAPIRYPAYPGISSSIEKCMKELEEAYTLTHEEVEKIIALRREKEIEDYDKRAKEAKELELRYRKVLDEVLEWTPPTKEHESLKDYAIEQLESSIKNDCSLYGEDPRGLPIEPPESYIETEIQYALRQLNNNINNEKENKQWHDSKIKWIDDLLGSFSNSRNKETVS